MALMAMILNSPRAVQVALYVVRAFVRLREAAVVHQDLARQLASCKDKNQVTGHVARHLQPPTRNQLRQVFDALRELTTPPGQPNGQLGLYGREKPRDKAVLTDQENLHRRRRERRVIPEKTNRPMRCNSTFGPLRSLRPLQWKSSTTLCLCSYAC
jgi:hypothetical protein